MDILLIEDENDKINHIKSYIKSTFDNIFVDVAKSYTSGVAKIYTKTLDLILLDMSLPLNDINEDNIEENEFETFGGIDILDEMKRVNKKIKVVVITAFDILGEDEKQINLSQLDEEMKQNYKDIYLGCIHYNSSAIEWKEYLYEYINKIKSL